MCKKIQRILSLALAILLTVAACLPAPASAAVNGPDEIKQQIKRVYKKSRSYFGRDSFDGFCGMFVSGQMYFLGISTSMIGGNGNEQYDTYARMKYTSGGYRVRAYPARKYTLRSALNEITNNGMKDVYNILVGFQRTKSAQGKRYGHASVIHAILDGTVYFSESYDLRMGGKTYPEGTPISCSIAEYCKYFEGTTTEFDGVIYFGLKTYTEECKTYSASFSGAVTEDTQLRSQPCARSVDESSEEVRPVQSGEQVTVTGLYLNTEGEYWYQISGTREAYLPAETVQVSKLVFGDVSVSGVKAPTAQRTGRSFSVQGTVTAEVNSIYSIRAQVYALEEGQEKLVISASDIADSNTYDLDYSAISQKLTFRKLPEGNYRYELAAVIGNHYVENDQLQTGWDTVSLWSSEFLVADKKVSAATIRFHACGGTTELDQTVVLPGSALTSLPKVQRAGHIFLGWYTEPDGGEPVDESLIPEKSMTLYARWTSYSELRSRWETSGQYRYFYSDGLSSMGCVEVDGVLYYFSTVDALGQSWNIWTEQQTTTN